MKRYFLTSFWVKSPLDINKTIIAFPYIANDNRMPTIKELFSKVKEFYNVEVISLVSISELSESDYNTLLNNN